MDRGWVPGTNGVGSATAMTPAGIPPAAGVSNLRLCGDGEYLMADNHDTLSDENGLIEPERDRLSIAPVPLLVSARTAAPMCGKSLRTWRSWDAGGLIPRPVRIARSTLWRVDELRDWVAAGCPRREEWEARE